MAECREEEQVLAVDVGAAGSRAPGRIDAQVWALGCGMGLGTAAPQRHLRRAGGAQVGACRERISGNLGAEGVPRGDPTGELPADREAL